MMGVADFPIELLKLIKIAPRDDTPVDSGTSSILISWGYVTCLTKILLHSKQHR